MRPSRAACALPRGLDRSLRRIEFGLTAGRYRVGLVLCRRTLGMATVTGLGHARSFYSPVLIVIASCDVLFAVMGGSTSRIASQTLVGRLFLAVTLSRRRVACTGRSGA